MENSCSPLAHALGPVSQYKSTQRLHQLHLIFIESHVWHAALDGVDTATLATAQLALSHVCLRIAVSSDTGARAQDSRRSELCAKGQPTLAVQRRRRGALQEARGGQAAANNASARPDLVQLRAPLTAEAAARSTG